MRTEYRESSNRSTTQLRNHPIASKRILIDKVFERSGRPFGSGRLEQEVARERGSAGRVVGGKKDDARHQSAGRVK